MNQKSFAGRGDVNKPQNKGTYVNKKQGIYRRCCKNAAPPVKLDWVVHLSILFSLSSETCKFTKTMKANLEKIIWI